MAMKLGRMVAHLECPTFTKSHNPCDHAKSHDKLKPLYLHYHSAYGDQTWWNGYLT